ncbi:Avirulence (Avh) protein [Phytophthora megakarya]|uniref:Avirulence (Avh) protein n=1 Tax=Phytophthora megakarya TaxID=4795 RepID=A0A225WYP7_9STRA|nr:Avirulence (Avh) protein [Phytophthora megakarya]
MQLKQFLVLVLITFISCCNTVTTAKTVVQSQNLESKTNRDITNVGRRYLKVGDEKIGANIVSEERIGATTPSFGQLFGLFPNLPKFSKLPVIKQINAIRKKFGTIVYQRWAKKHRNNFM